ncbi:phosphoribosyltransferase family protein [Arenimonas sp.]|uniref:phosphoribosyltransferase family protein n=1 Tax=Arenimonas sp. TaxID=1872635 RepID=UPI0039E4A797
MSDDRFRLYNAEQLAPVIDDMARQAANLLDGTPTVILGMLRRGAPLADRLYASLQEHVPGADIRRLDVLVKRYADTLELLHPDTRLDAPVDAHLVGSRVIVVDDVLYQGYSLMRVFEWLAGQRPAAVHAAVLVDRQRYRMPVRADIVGLTMKIAPTDVIECNVPPYESDFAVDLLRPGG